MELNEAIKTLQDRIETNKVILNDKSYESGFDKFVKTENEALETLLKQIEQPKQVMIVWANDIENGKKTGSPWIYGCYSDQSEGYDIQETMQNSEDYGHLYWSNNVVLLNKQ